MRSGTIGWIIALLVLLPCRSFGADAPSDGASDALHSSIGDEPIRTSSTTASPAANNSELPARSNGGELEYSRVLGALAVVLGLIFLLRWLGRIAFPASLGRGGAGRSVELLSRSPLSPKQQILLVRVGRRVLVVGDSGGQMSSLGEIRDPDEISELVGQVISDKRAVTPRAFGSMFGRFRRNFEESPESPSSTPEVQHADEERTITETRDELSGLRARVRLLANEFNAVQTEGR